MVPVMACERLVREIDPIEERANGVCELLAILDRLSKNKLMTDGEVATEMSAVKADRREERRRSVFPQALSSLTPESPCRPCSSRVAHHELFSSERRPIFDRLSGFGCGSSISRASVGRRSPRAGAEALNFAYWLEKRAKRIRRTIVVRKCRDPGHYSYPELAAFEGFVVIVSGDQHLLDLDQCQASRTPDDFVASVLDLNRRHRPGLSDHKGLGS